MTKVLQLIGPWCGSSYSNTRIYNYFRDYDAFSGRYIESDPIGLGDGVNTYAYARNAPSMNFDAVGLFFINYQLD